MLVMDCFGEIERGSKHIIYKQYILQSDNKKITTWLPEKYKGKKLGENSIIILKEYPEIKWRVRNCGNMKMTERELYRKDQIRRNFSDKLSSNFIKIKKRKKK